MQATPSFIMRRMLRLWQTEKIGSKYADCPAQEHYDHPCDRRQDSKSHRQCWNWFWLVL